MDIQGSYLGGKPLNPNAVEFQGRAQLFGGVPSPNTKDLYRDIATRQNAALKGRMQNPMYDVSNRIQNNNKALIQHINIMENPNMQKMASYKEVYQLYKKAGWWDNVKSDLGKAWEGFNDYADKNQWVRPTLYGAGGALGGYGLGSLFKNPLLRVLFTILGGAGGALGGLTHNQNRPYYNVDDTRQDPLSIEAAQGAVKQQEADQRAANEAAMKAQATKPAVEKKSADKVSYKAALNDPVYRKAFFGKTLEEKLKEDAAKGAEAAAKK